MLNKNLIKLIKYCIVDLCLRIKLSDNTLGKELFRKNIVHVIRSSEK